MTDTNDLILEYLELVDHIEQLTDRKNQIQEAMRALGQGKHSAQAGTVSVSPPTRRFDATLACEVLTPEQQQLCSETVITSAKAKRILAPALYEMCSKESGQARVTVKAA